MMYELKPYQTSTVTKDGVEIGDEYLVNVTDNIRFRMLLETRMVISFSFRNPLTGNLFLRVDEFRKYDDDR